MLKSPHKDTFMIFANQYLFIQPSKISLKKIFILCKFVILYCRQHKFDTRIECVDFHISHSLFVVIFLEEIERK